MLSSERNLLQMNQRNEIERHFGRIDEFIYIVSCNPAGMLMTKAGQAPASGSQAEFPALC